MKDLKDIIQEKLKVGSKTQIHTRNQEDWNIQNAENGDFVVWTPGTLYFIYAGLNKDFKVNNTTDDTIVYHILYNPEQDKIYPGPDTGIGGINKPNVYRLATEEEYEILLGGINKHGYKWDETKLEVIKK